MFVIKTVLIPLFLALILGACSSDEDFGLGNGGSNNSNQEEPDPDPVPDNEEVVDVTLALGSGVGDDFVSGAMTTTTDGATLSFGGDTAVTVNIVDASDNSLYTDSTVKVSFTSPCIANGRSKISSPISVSNGIATTAYNALTCSGIDTITASLSDGTTATKSITIADQIFGSLQFVSAAPTSIALKGSGSSAHPEVSKLTFVLKDNTDAPIQGKTVSYSLSTTVGGITLSSPTSVTAADGSTSVSLNAGGVSVSVSVTATVTDGADNSIQTTSNSISIVGGIADQNSFSLSVSTFNPRGWNFDGSTSSINIRAADRYNNPAPDATQISFVTSGGSIVGSCALSGGACSVDWTSQNPRPINVDVDGDGNCDLADGDICGLVKILARTTGEESFTDTNSNGKYDVGETVITNLDEAYNDENGNGQYDADEGEFFSDFNEDGVYTTKAAGGLFQGTNCSAAALTAGHCANLVDVRESATLCMSTDGVVATDNTDGDIDVGAGENSVIVTFSDTHGIMPASGTVINVSAVGATILSGGGKAEIPNACLDGNGNILKAGVEIVVLPDADPTTFGLLKIEITQVNGLKWSHLITITD